jgi:hypothetical protein
MDSLGAGAAETDPVPTDADEAIEYSLSNERGNHVAVLLQRAATSP